MKKPTQKFVIYGSEYTYDCEFIYETEFEKLPVVNRAHGFVFDDEERVCIAKWKGDKHWGDLGGGVEKCDKTSEDTFIREVNEEADLDIKDIKRVGYIKAIKRGEIQEDYGVIFVARVKKIKPQTLDPAEDEIPERKFINVKDFNKYCGWGENGEFQIKKALDKLREK